MAGGNIGHALQAKLRGNILSFLVTTGTTIYRGCAVAIDTATGLAVVASDLANRKFVGIAEENIVGDGTKKVRVRRRGVFRLEKTGGTAAATEIGTVIAADVAQQAAVDQTFEAIGTATNDCVVGIVVGVAATNFWWVDIWAAGFENFNMAAYTTTADLASAVDAAKGSELIGWDDGGAFTAAATVAAALDELYQHVLTAQAFIQIPLNAWRLEAGGPITGTPAAAEPGMIQLTNEELVIEWPTNAAPGEIITSITVPPDMNVGADMILHIFGMPYGAGAITDSPVFTVQAFQSSVGDAALADVDFGVESTEFTAVKTVQEETSTLDNANIAAAPSTITLIINPKDTELPTDSFYLYGTWIEYTRKILAS